VSLKNLFARLFRRDRQNSPSFAEDVIEYTLQEPDDPHERNEAAPSQRPLAPADLPASLDFDSGPVSSELVALPSSVATLTRSPVTNCVEFLYGVMDDMYPELLDQYGDATNEVLAQARKELRTRLNDLDAGEQVPYETNSHRFAYLYLYATGRASIMHSIIGKFPCLSELLDRDHVKVCSIGGGPGTDLVGISKYVSAIGSRTRISATIYDREAGWKSYWDAIQRRLPEYPITDVRYVCQDFLESNNGQSSITDMTGDLYTLSYCLAEFRTRQPLAEPYFRDLFRRVPRGSYLLFIDVDHSKHYEWFDNLASDTGFEAVPDVSGNRRGRRSIDLLTTEETQSASRGFRSHLPRPRTDPKVAYRLCRKVS
jgi:hypothetical protein